MKTLILKLLVLIAILVLASCKTIEVKLEPMEPCYAGDVCYA